MTTKTPMLPRLDLVRVEDAMRGADHVRPGDAAAGAGADLRRGADPLRDRRQLRAHRRGRPPHLGAGQRPRSRMGARRDACDDDRRRARGDPAGHRRAARPAVARRRADGDVRGHPPAGDGRRPARRRRLGARRGTRRGRRLIDPRAGLASPVPAGGESARALAPDAAAALAVLALTAPAAARAQVQFCGPSDRSAAPAVPLDRTGALPGAVSLAIERRRPRAPAEPPLFSGSPGGPGQSATRAFPAAALDGLLGDARRHRDLVVLDQRGTGARGAPACPALETAASTGAAAAGAACADLLGRRGTATRRPTPSPTSTPSAPRSAMTGSRSTARRTGRGWRSATRPRTRIGSSGSC